VPAQALAAAPIVAEHRSPLWADGRADEFVLRCGKVQNLRIAIRGFDGIEVPAGQVLGFWAQVGRPARWRGFVPGREIVNGCVVPTVGGGLCQLSNALATLAVASRARLVERHRHTAAIEAQGPRDEDATVAWNHVDLRIVADFAYRLEVELTAEELVVRMRARPGADGAGPSSGRRRPSPLPPVRDERPVAHGCLTCDRTGCFRHRPHGDLVRVGSTALLLNDRTPELAGWLEQTPEPGAGAAPHGTVRSLGETATWMVPWVRPRLRGRAWVPPPQVPVRVARMAGWKRALRQRLLRGEGAARQAGRQRAAEDLARDYARCLQPEHTHLVVAQELLVPLWRLGVLGGRRYDVHVHELPASELQARLDAAAAAEPRAASLRDFRVDAAWQQDEWAALARADRLLSPHHEVRRVLVAAGLAVFPLEWHIPLPSQPAGGGRSSVRTGPVEPGRPTLTLAASALARKGAHELAVVARALGARVLILGSPPADPSVWDGVAWEVVGYGGDWLARSDVVVLPAHVEHQPRALLQALAAGVPVVATPACGIGPRPGLIEVTPGDAALLQAALRRCLPTIASVTE
jgi:hypothetical protein